ncbi:MAG: transposase, partial [Nitrososphaerales archaeon]
APNFHDAYKKEIRSMYAPKATEHIQEIRLAGKVHNNKMERMNGEIRNREKTMRGLKIEDTPILKGIQIFHNFVRTHEGLDGKTPAEASGIKVEGENKWKTLIQNAKRSSSTDFTQGEKLA